MPPKAETKTKTATSPSSTEETTDFQSQFDALAQQLADVRAEGQKDKEALEQRLHTQAEKHAAEIKALTQEAALQGAAQTRSFRIPSVFEAALNEVINDPKNKEAFEKKTPAGKAIPLKVPLIREKREHETFTRQMCFAMIRRNGWKDPRSGAQRYSYGAWIPEMNLTLFDDRDNPGSFEGQEWNIQVLNAAARTIQQRVREKAVASRQALEAGAAEGSNS